MAAGGLRELLVRYDDRAEEPIIASVPVATDTSPDRINGNALSTCWCRYRCSSTIR
jgi:diacylglycerol O-acyltransferase / wax synthase